MSTYLKTHTVLNLRVLSTTLLFLFASMTTRLAPLHGAESFNESSSSNLEAYMNTFGSGVADNLRYVVRESYNDSFTLIELIAKPLNDRQAKLRCSRLLQDLENAPQAEQVANVWVLSGVVESDEQHKVCLGER